MQAKRQLWLLLGCLAAVVAWLYMHRVLLPWEQYVNVEGGTMKALMGDLYSPWFGARALLVEGKNPYGPEVTREIQTAFYGHTIQQTYADPTAIIDEQRFAYPVYVVFLLAPAAHLGFDTVRAWAPFVLALFVAASVQLWLSVLKWKPPPTVVLALTVFVLATPQIAQGMRLRQLGLIVGSLLALATWLVLRDYLMAAGTILAVCTIKPQMVVLALAWFLIWSTGDLGKRWRLAAGFGAGLAILVGAGEWILPGWLPSFFQGLAAYRKYGPFSSLLQVVLGAALGTAVALMVVGGLLILAWTNRKHAADSPEFTLSLSAFLLGTGLAVPLVPPFNQVLLILPALMVVRDWAMLSRSARALFAVVIGWPWIASAAMLIFPPQLKSHSHLPLLPSALVLLVPFLLPVLVAARRTPTPFSPRFTRGA